MTTALTAVAIVVGGIAGAVAASYVLALGIDWIVRRIEGR